MSSRLPKSATLPAPRTAPRAGRLVRRKARRRLGGQLMVARHLLYILIAVASAAAAWFHGIAWVREGGNLLLLPTFFLDAYRSGSAAAFLTIDILAAWAVFMIWVVPDAVRIGLGSRKGDRKSVVEGKRVSVRFV